MSFLIPKRKMAEIDGETERIFTIYAKTNPRFLNRDESFKLFRDGLYSIGCKTVGSEEFYRFMRALDTNKDCKISRKELREFMKRNVLVEQFGN